MIDEFLEFALGDFSGNRILRPSVSPAQALGTWGRYIALWNLLSRQAVYVEYRVESKPFG